MIGTASCKCVRPTLSTSANAAARFSKAVASERHALLRRAVLEREGQTGRSRDHVVGRLSHVDVIVGVDLVVGALRAAKHFRGAIGQHLVGVHVVRGAGARLIDVDDELIAQRAAEHLVGRRDDRVRDAAIEPAGVRDWLRRRRA